MKKARSEKAALEAEVAAKKLEKARDDAYLQLNRFIPYGWIGRWSESAGHFVFFNTDNGQVPFEEIYMSVATRE